MSTRSVPSRQPPPPLGLALGLCASAVAILLAADCEASSISLQLLPRCTEARFLSAGSPGEVAVVVIIVALAYAASALLLIFASAAFAHRWRRLSSCPIKTGYLSASPKLAAIGNAPVVTTASPAPRIPIGATPRAARLPGENVVSPHAARGRAITNARALEAYLSFEGSLKRKSATASGADLGGTTVGPSLLASPAATGATLAPNAGSHSGVGGCCGKHEMEASMRPMWVDAVGSPSGTAANNRHQLGVPSCGLVPAILPSLAGAASYGRSPPVGVTSPIAPGEHGPGTYPPLSADVNRFPCGVGSFPHANTCVRTAAASPQGSVAYPRGSPRCNAIVQGPAGSFPGSPCFGSATPQGASPFGSPFAGGSLCGAVGLSPFAAASGPAAALGSYGADQSRRISSGGGSGSKYQRAMYIPSSGDKQHDPSVIARRATRLLRSLNLLDESVERGSTLSK
jgi:hypothetical protein